MEKADILSKILQEVKNELRRNAGSCNPFVKWEYIENIIKNLKGGSR
jgi:hypothetical protein